MSISQHLDAQLLQLLVAPNFYTFHKIIYPLQVKIDIHSSYYKYEQRVGIQHEIQKSNFPKKINLKEKEFIKYKAIFNSNPSNGDSFDTSTNFTKSIIQSCVLIFWSRKC